MTFSVFANGVPGICVSQNSVVRPSEIVHYVVYVLGGVAGVQRQLLCDAPWVVANSMDHARVVTEVDPGGRTMTITLTSDPVDCMKCLVRSGQGS